MSGNRMRAIVQTAYGDESVYRLAQVERPTCAGDQVLIKVEATSLHPDIWHTMRGWPYPLRLMGSGVRRPKDVVPGTDLAGTVVEVGAEVSRFHPGDRVFGQVLTGVNLWRNGGTFAEYAACSPELLAPIPDGVSFVEAAAIPTTAIIALQFIHGQPRLKAGDRLLVNGAAGGVGSMVVQMAKAVGAEVTAVDRGDKLAMLRDLGADHVIDHTTTDFTREPVRYDHIIDIPGNHSFKEIKRALEPIGQYELIGHDDYGRSGGHFLGSIGKMASLMVRVPFSKHIARPDSNPLADVADPMGEIADMMARGELRSAVDRTFPLAETPEAMTYLTQGDVRGKVVITI